MKSEFEQQLAIKTEKTEKSERLYIFFGGINNQLGIPPFEFYKSSKILSDSKIFIRDLKQAWYQAGLLKSCRNIKEIQEFLQKEISDFNPKELFFIGNSMGGYAAILFAALIGKGKVIAFAPQTFICLPKRIFCSENRWRRQVYKTYLKSFLKPHIYDLNELLSRRQKSEVKIEIFVSSKAKLDIVHSDNIKEFSNVKVHVLDFGGHGVVKRLRDSGQLEEILKNSDFGSYAIPNQDL